jgi:NAD(P)H dehydrogenase (quinone)
MIWINAVRGSADILYLSLLDWTTLMARIAIIVGHARTEIFCEALGEAYARGARAGGHDVEIFVTSKMKFDPVLHEGFERVQPLERDLQAAHDALRAADHLVVIFPLWMGSMPSILMGFFERVFQPDLAADIKKGKILKLLKGKSARIIVTMNMPSMVFRWWYRAHGLKVLKRNVLRLVGVGRIRSTLHGDVDGGGAERRKQWLLDAEALGRRAI